MEYPSQEIIRKVERIIQLLELDGSKLPDYYKRFFEHMLKKLNQPHDIEGIAESILKVYGGMATFNDVSIYKEGVDLYNEQIEFENLRTELFLNCKDIILASRSKSS